VTAESHFPPERRAEAKARIAAATPGPWAWTDWQDQRSYAVKHDGGLTAEGEFLSGALVSLTAKDDGEPDGWIVAGQNTVDGVFLSGRAADAHFIKDARADLPDAIAEIERLERVVAELRAK
jgi:hypothetical protein